MPRQHRFPPMIWCSSKRADAGAMLPRSSHSRAAAGRRSWAPWPYGRDPRPAALVGDGEIVAAEPAESAPRRVRIDGEPRAVVAVLIGSGRWVELRSVPAEIEAPRWLILLVPCALLGPIAILGLRWAQRTPPRSRRETVIAWGFLAPAALHLTIFTIGPAVYAIYLASTVNLRALVRDPLTWNSLVTSAAYALYVPISVALALAAALAIHRYQRRWGGWGVRLLSAVFLLPYVASVVAIAVLWQAIYRAGSLGLGRPDWLSNPHTALLALMLVSIWAHVGGQMIVFLGGLQAIPHSYFDAALVDGAGAWRRFWRSEERRVGKECRSRWSPYH